MALKINFEKQKKILILQLFGILANFLPAFVNERLHTTFLVFAKGVTEYILRGRK